MAMAPHRRGRSPPALPDDLLEDILFRLPPEDPSCLLRASLVCKHWRDLISHPRFLRRLHAQRRAPQMLGFLQNSMDERFVSSLPLYVPTSPFPFPFPDRGAWHVLGYRHGRAVFRSKSTEKLLLVWEPLTGKRWEVPVPADFKIRQQNASVLCAADGYDHLDCHGKPFRVVLVFCAPIDEDSIMSACVYSSETAAWGELALRDRFSLIFERPAVLVGNSLLYFLSSAGFILEYDLARHALDVVYTPDLNAAFRVMLVQSEDGGLGMVETDEDGWSLLRWSWEVSEEGDAKPEWVKRPAIYPNDSLPVPDVNWGTLMLRGFVEGASTILVSTSAGIFTVQLQSKRTRRVCKNGCNLYPLPLVPVVSSYTLGSTLERHRYLQSPDFSDKADGEELLFCKGSVALEKGDFVVAVDCLGQVLKLRYGRALLYKAQKATNLLGNAPKKGDTKEGHNSNGKDQEDRNSENDKEMTGDRDDSDVELAGKMLNIARVIIEKSPDNTFDSLETSKILSALTEVSMEKRKR